MTDNRNNVKDHFKQHSVVLDTQTGFRCPPPRGFEHRTDGGDISGGSCEDLAGQVLEYRAGSMVSSYPAHNKYQPGRVALGVWR